ncbi:MAG: hypothetical protein ABI251_13155 [Mycobacteriaceae bacterium]
MSFGGQFGGRFGQYVSASLYAATSPDAEPGGFYSPAEFAQLSGRPAHHTWYHTARSEADATPNVGRLGGVGRSAIRDAPEHHGRDTSANTR